MYHPHLKSTLRLSFIYHFLNENDLKNQRGLTILSSLILIFFLFGKSQSLIAQPFLDAEDKKALTQEYWPDKYSEPIASINHAEDYKEDLSKKEIKPEISKKINPTPFVAIKATTKSELNKYKSNSSLFGLNVYNSADIPKVISPTTSSTITSTITVPPSGTGVITDINLTNLDISHTYIDDLTITLTSPSGKVVTLISGLCSFHDDLLIDFDDQGSSFFTIPCPPTDGLAYHPLGSLDIFNSEDPVGVWTLEIQDNAPTDGGSLNAWSLEILTDTTPTGGGGPCTQPNCTANFTGSCSTYNLNSGDTLCINADFNCNIAINTGSLVYVAAGVLFSPGNINGDVRGTIVNCGTARFNNVSLGFRAKIVNNGVMAFNSSINISGAAEFINNVEGIMDFNSNFQLDRSSTFLNNGQVDVNGSFEVRSGTDFINNNELNVSQNFTTHTGGETINNGLVISSGGNINMNSGSRVINNCTFSAPNQININDDLQNNGLLFTGNGSGQINVNTSGRLTNNGDLVTRNFQVNGRLFGNGYIWTTGTTLLNSGATAGTDAKGLNIYDASTPPNGQFFDNQNGSVHSTVTNDPPSPANPIPPLTNLANTCSAILIGTIPPEICGNGIDDDGDGLTDCDDPDCSFQTVITPQHILCNGTNTGAATATTDKGGIVPIIYSWSNGASDSITITNLSPGDYTVTATDAIGCSSVTSTTITELPPMGIDTTISGVSCAGGNDGAIDLTVSGGTSPYSYNWSNGFMTPIISNMTPGDYTVTITDLNLCDTIVTFTIDEPTQNLSIAIDSSAAITCNGGSDGIIYTSGNGGTPPYSYAWSNGGSTATVSGLSAGSHTVTITDANGCTSNINFNLQDPPPLGGINITNNANLCGGTSHTWTAADLGVGTTYSWDFGPNASPATAIGIGPHNVTYNIPGMANVATTTTLTVTAANGCTNTATDDFNILAIPQATVIGTDPSCNTDDGEILITFQDSPNRTGINFSIDNQASWSNNVNDNTGTYTFTNLSSGTYDVWARWGDNGCPVSLGAEILISLSCGEICNDGLDNDGDGLVDCDDPDCPSPTAALTNNGDLCGGTSHTWTATDAGVGATYDWDFGPNATPATATGIGPHNVTYNIPGIANVATTTTLTVTNTNGCASTATDNFDILAIPQATISGTDPSCDTDDGEIVITFQDSPNRTGINFSIDNQVSWTGDINDNTGTYTFTNLSSGTYDVWIRWGDDACPVSLGAEILTSPTCGEICNDGIDNDGDGNVDCLDADCIPQINSVNTSSPNNCPLVNNGFITINATGSNLEYSINNGSSFQASNLFSNLTTGTYQVVVRNSVSGCSMSHTTSSILNPIICPEVCDNGIDDDLDGLIDLNDPDCTCCKSKGPSLLGLRKN